jgi:hypothetical protein
MNTVRDVDMKSLLMVRRNHDNEVNDLIHTNCDSIVSEGVNASDNRKGSGSPLAGKEGMVR